MPPSHPSRPAVAAAYRTLIAHETEPKEQDFYRTRLQRLEQATEPECEFDCRSRVAAAGVGVYCPQCSAKCADTDLTTQLAKAIRAAWVDRLDWDELAQGALEFLTSAGRLIPSGGMALTAEQVEDVRTVVSADAAAWNRLSPALFAAYRLRRALFPATEPEEEETKAEAGGDFIEIVFTGPPAAVSGRFVEVENPQGASISVGEWIDRGDGFWALRIQSDEPHLMSQLGVTEIRNAAFREAADLLDQALKANPVTTLVTGRGRILDLITSVPAPTETGPWDSIEEVPEGVTVRGTNPVAGLWRGGPYWKSVSPEHSAAVSSLAPFVAAEEG